MTVIEELVAKLRGKLSRLAVYQPIHSSNETSCLANEAAIEWVHQAVEDIAAMAPDLRAACHEVFLQKRATAKQDLIVEKDQHLKVGITR